ncbi:hypothetical protein SCANM63S_03696 [Streptomyces canarius]
MSQVTTTRAVPPAAETTFGAHVPPAFVPRRSVVQRGRPSVRPYARTPVSVSARATSPSVASRLSLPEVNAETPSIFRSHSVRPVRVSTPHTVSQGFS